MKNIFLLAAMIILLLFSRALNAQTGSPFNSSEIHVSDDTLAQMVLFTGKYLEGTTYLNWNVVGQQLNGIYLIYYSRDGETYQVLGSKTGIGVPIKNPIAYYFQDEHPGEGATYYKVVHISENQTYLVSDRIEVDVKASVLSCLK